jgi:gliding motility-associated protein GldE
LDSHSDLFSRSGFFSFFPLVINLQDTTFLGILLIILLLLAFVISGAEVALFSLGHKDLNVLKTKQHPGAKRIVSLLEEPQELYTSLLIAGTFINISIIVLLNFLLSQAINFEGWGGLLNVLFRVVVIAFVLIFFGKILPKVWATQNNVRFAYGSVSIIEALHLLLRRISRRMVSIANGIGKRTGANRAEEYNMQQLDEAIDIQSDEDATVEEKNILKGVAKFGNITVKQIMRSRLDVSGVPHQWKLTEVIRKVEELHYSRLPVYKGNLDTVVGILNTKDLVPYLNETDGFDWHSLLRPPYFVPEQKFIEDLLKEFQQKRTHFAVVVDEFGGTSGIVTMEDILEEVIGDIRDEFDEEESPNRRVDDHNFIFEGKTMLHDACRLMKLPLDTFDRVKGESDSIGGLVLELAGAFPEVNEEVPCGDFVFTVMQTEKNRIRQVNVRIKPGKD